MSNTDEISIGDVRFIPSSRDLRDAQGKRIGLRKKSSEVLAYLATRRGEIVSKAEIMEAVWGEVSVTDESLTQCIADIRRAIRDKEQSLLTTHVGKGYSLSPAPAMVIVASHHRRNLILSGIVMILTIAAVAWALWPEPAPDGPARIAVLAFDDLSPSEDRGYLGDGIAEGIITELARYPELAVIARNSSFSFRGTATDIAEIAEKLRADFVVEGSMQKSGDRLKVTVQLINAHDGTHQWAHEFNDEIDDYFDVQSKIVLGIATHIGRELAWHEPQTGGPEKVSALHLYMRGNDAIQGQTPEDVRKARDLYLQSIEADPYAPYGYVGMALIVWQELPQPDLYKDMPLEDLLQMGIDYAEKALAADPDYYMAHISRGDMHDRAGENELAVMQYQWAARLNPSSADAMALTAEPLMFAGRTDEAIAVMERAIDINPIPPGWYYKSMAFVLWSAGRCEEGASWIENISRTYRPWELRHLMVNQACAGDIEAARNTAARHARMLPDYTVQTYMRNRTGFNNDELLFRFINDLRVSGMPEG
ncbi:winged helix-turn-helix domain-containing tetratricopeptide repeat protein [Aliiruegeria lutimaris]|uniref:TolB amino-terminal domain-containing protein n=1 Tax=Aliiruegeria lutimaris TaxID=571298 RepID=A0A1G9NCT3_9RHOB|nr:winged helix-turn-helix domain-containing protein [Aliiruegeria lutimaris]SDL84249.1 TolB amino-terminal domain-containing protein [Aliiruegeria lutimaris]